MTKHTPRIEPMIGDAGDAWRVDHDSPHGTWKSFSIAAKGE